MNELAGWKKVGIYVAMVLLTAAFVMAGGAKATAQQPMVDSFTHFGLPLWFMYFIGVAEVLGGIGLWIKRMSGLAAIGLLIIMIGAVVMHLIYDPFAQAIPALVFGVLLAIIAKVRLPEMGASSNVTKATV